MFRIAPALVVALSLNDVSHSQLVPRDGSAAIHARSEHVLAVVEDGLARTTSRQTFVNTGERSLEAIFELPLPEGAALVDVAMTVGGHRLEGLLAERRRARATYDRIVRSQRDPALVEQIGASTYRLSVFPVVPHEETIVELTWIEHAPLVDGAFRYVLPLAQRPSPPVEGAQPGADTELFVEVRLRSSVPIERATSSRDDVEVARTSPSEARVVLETRRAAREPDLVVTAELEARAGGLSVKTFRESDGDGWFLALLTPPRLAETERIARDVILVIDTSGSMKQGGKLEQAQRAAAWLLAHVHPDDRVNVLRFSSDVQAFAPEPVEASADNLARLAGFVAGFKPLGGTALGDALQAVAALPDAGDRVRTVVLLTDGKPTSGETDRGKLVQLGLAARTAGARVFPFGVGEDVDGALLRGVARAGGGQAELFRPGGEIETRLVRFLARTSTPRLANPELAVEGIELYDVLPRPLPDAYAGEQIAITGRYRGAGQGRLTLTDRVGGERRGYAADVAFRAQPGGSEHVRQLFARQKLFHLEEQHRLRTGLGDDAYYAALDSGAYSTADEIVEEMIAVSLGHGVQCAYTSFLVLLPEDRARVDPRELSTLDAALERARELVGRPLGEPILKDAELMDFNEESVLSDDPDFLADSPFDAKSFNDVIGVGGGAGGAFSGRFEHREPRRAAGGAGVEQATLDGLEWLARQQGADGSWCAVATGAGDLEATSLALLAFLGGGQTTRAGRHRETVVRGFKWLRAQQDFESGRFGDPDDLAGQRGHALATLALCEAYVFSRSPLLRGSAQKAVAALLAARDPGGAWNPARVNNGSGDAELAAWRLAALWTAERAGLTIDAVAFEDARAWLDARASNLGGPEGAAVLWCRTLVGLDAEADVGLMLFDPPSPELLGSEVHVLSWLHAANVLRQLTPDVVTADRGWSQALEKLLLESQGKVAGEARGSWSARAGWSPVEAAAVGVLCLEARSRYARGAFRR